MRAWTWSPKEFSSSFNNCIPWRRRSPTSRLKSPWLNSVFITSSFLYKNETSPKTKRNFEDSLFQPFFRGLDIFEELLIVAGVLQMGLQTLSELKNPCHLGLHRCDVGLDGFGRWMILLLGQELTSLLDSAELFLTLL
jgi:hypothetical protein